MYILAEGPPPGKEGAISTYNCVQTYICMYLCMIICVCTYRYYAISYVHVMMNGKSEGRVEEAGFALLPAAPASICFDKVHHKDFESLILNLLFCLLIFIV